MPTLTTILQDVFDTLLPPICAVCGGPLDDREENICGGCRDAFMKTGRTICWRCGAPVREAAKRRCPHCPKEPVHFDFARAPYLYRGHMRDAIQAFKYQHRIELGRPLGRAMFMGLREYLSGGAFDDEPISVLTPVPMHLLRRMHRGYNHAEVLAEELAALAKIPCVPHLLIRRRHTPRQALLPLEERARNIFGAFECPAPHELRGQHVGLVDDVFTSGHTVNECARVLRAAGAATIHVLALTRAV